MKIRLNPNKLVSYFSFFSSWWIANFGVVPLFTLAAFLFDPILTFLFDLLFLVTRVFDTIFILPIEYILKHKQLFYNIKHKLLPKLSPFVKVISKAFLALFMINSLVNAKNMDHLTTQIILAKGQHHEITDIKLDHYTIGNKEVISHKFSPKNNKIIIKGKMLGFSEILIWKKNKKSKIFKVYVFSKKEQLNTLNLANGLKSLGLDVKLNGPIIIVRGHIENMDNFHTYRKIISSKKQNITQQVSYSQKVKNKIIGEVYFHFYNNYIDEIKCNKVPYNIHCYYHKTNPPSNSLLKRLKDKFGVLFFSINTQNKKNNYKIKLKLIQIEKLNGEELNFGLDQLSTSVGDIMRDGIIGAIKQNKISLQNQNINMSTLAEPTALLGIDTPLIIKIGDDIPYTSEDKNNVKTIWKFAGLKIHIKLRKKGNLYKLDYTTMVKKPGNKNTITGSEEKSSIYIKPGAPIELFSIGYKTSKVSRGSFPALSKIPLLGNLFISKSHGSNYKKITGLITLEQIK